MVSKKELQNQIKSLVDKTDSINKWVKSISDRLEINELTSNVKDYVIYKSHNIFEFRDLGSIQKDGYKLVKIFDDKRQLWIKDDPKEKPKDQKQDTKKVVNQKNKKTRRK